MPTSYALYHAITPKESEDFFIPVWGKGAVALALGCGTIGGWKRIVVTMGEKIGAHAAGGMMLSGFLFWVFRSTL